MDWDTAIAIAEKFTEKFQYKVYPEVVAGNFVESYPYGDTGTMYVIQFNTLCRRYNVLCQPGFTPDIRTGSE